MDWFLYDIGLRRERVNKSDLKLDNSLTDGKHLFDLKPGLSHT